MKKLFALIIALCMVLSLGTAALAADAADPAVQEAYVDYIYEWLLAEDAVNDNMDINIIETEFMPLVEAGDFVSFPADMLFNGMLNTGCPMTIDEFAAQYVPAEGGSDEASGEASGEAKSVEDAYLDYLHEFLLAELPVNTGGMTLEIIENEFMPMLAAGNYVDPPAVLLFNGMLDSGVAMTFEEFEAQYVPAGAGEAKSVEDAFVDYIYEWLLEEQKVNTGGMTIEIIENEFMPLIEAGDYVTFPAEMLWSGMLDSGCPMTFEEFAAQYVPAAAPAAAADPQAAYADYIYEWLLAEDAVNDNMDINIIETEFMPLVEAGDFVSFPADMLFNGMLNNGVAMTFEEWSAQQ